MFQPINIFIIIAQCMAILSLKEVVLDVNELQKESSPLH